MKRFIDLSDKIGIKKDDLVVGKQNKTFRTQIDAIDGMGNVIFSRKQNNVVLGGSIYVLEKLLNVRAGLQVETLNNIMGINNESVAFSDTDIIPKEHFLCLWGIGIGGAGDTIGNVHPVNFYEREIGSKNNSTEMIPFRVVNEPLSETEKEMYYFHKDLGDGMMGYYLKKFAADPTIKVLWNDGIDGEDGTEVTADVWNTDKTTAIEVFAEITLFLSKKDGREYFDLIDEIEKARINTISLCTGLRAEYESGKYDYQNVLMMTKLNFGNEMLENKEITFRYRIFTN